MLKNLIILCRQSVPVSKKRVFIWTVIWKTWPNNWHHCLCFFVNGDILDRLCGVLSERKEHFCTTILHLRQQFQNEEALSCKPSPSVPVVHAAASVQKVCVNAVKPHAWTVCSHQSALCVFGVWLIMWALLIFLKNEGDACLCILSCDFLCAIRERRSKWQILPVRLRCGAEFTGECSDILTWVFFSAWV